VAAVFDNIFHAVALAFDDDRFDMVQEEIGHRGSQSSVIVEDLEQLRLMIWEGRSVPVLFIGRYSR